MDESTSTPPEFQRPTEGARFGLINNQTHSFGVDQLVFMSLSFLPNCPLKPLEKQQNSIQAPIHANRYFIIDVVPPPPATELRWQIFPRHEMPGSEKGETNPHLAPFPGRINMNP